MYGVITTLPAPIEMYDGMHAEMAKRVVLPLMRELAGDQPLPSIEQATETLDIHGLVVPGSNILI